MSLHLSFVSADNGVRIQLSERHTFGRRILAPSNWPVNTEQAVTPALRFMRRIMATGQARIEGDAVFVPMADLIAAPASILKLLGLPEHIAPLSIRLTLRGRVETTDGRIEVHWTDADFRNVTIHRQGLLVAFGGQNWRLSPTFVILLDAVDAYNLSAGQPVEARLPHWARVQDQIENLTGGPVDAEPALRNFRIYQAGAFALDVREAAGGVQFDPIPMARSMRNSLADIAAAPENGQEDLFDLKDGIEHALLPPELQRRFQEAFNQDGLATRPAYVLARNTYMVVEPEVRSAFDVVKAAQRAPSSERRAFIRNPRASLIAAMPDGGEAVGTLFVETRQYSDRVLGLGLWEKPILEWIKRQSSGWLPEAFKFTVGSTTLSMTAERLEQLGARYDQAVAEGQQTFDFDGHVLGVEESAKAFDRLRSGEPASVESADHPTGGEPVDRDVLLLKQNFEESDYGLTAKPRPLFAQKIFPSDSVLTEPKPHQIEGFGWLVDAWTSGLPGALLADDMGLGKTLQSLAFLAWLRENTLLAGERQGELQGPILIVAPTALLRNWQKEAETHLRRGTLGTCAEVFGAGLARLKQPDRSPEDAIAVDALREADWVLTTYETLANYHRAFARVGFSIAVFDEMQKIKAPDTINTHAAKTINADFVLGMTGTPIENRIEDLWCIMDRIAPGYLGALKPFSARYGDDDEQALAELKAKLDQKAENAPPIMLRRMKQDHLRGLPERTVRTYSDPGMPAIQADAYEVIVDEAAGGSSRGKGDMLKIIHALRGVSLHPLGAKTVDPYNEQSARDWIAGSARVRQVMFILTEIRSRGEKALVFIEDRAVQSAFAAVAAGQLGLRREPDIINGETGADLRQVIVDRFQTQPAGFDLLVLSPKAAGIGLTITAANHVIHLSRWWNPAVEDQCNDRVYRIGQDKPVTVHVPMAIHPKFGDSSFDLKLNALLERKRTLSRDMLAPPVTDSDTSELFGQTVGASRVEK